MNYVGFSMPMSKSNDKWEEHIPDEVSTLLAEIERLYSENKLKEAERIGGILKLDKNLEFFYLRNYSNHVPLSDLRIAETF